MGIRWFKSFVQLESSVVLVILVEITVNNEFVNIIIDGFVQLGLDSS